MPFEDHYSLIPPPQSLQLCPHGDLSIVAYASLYCVCWGFWGRKQWKRDVGFNLAFSKVSARPHPMLKGLR